MGTKETFCRVELHASVEDCLRDLNEIKVPLGGAPDTLESEIPCLFSRLKHHIIRLRRGRGEDWPFFRQEVEQHRESILENLSSRWLISIIDTWVDYGSPIERRNAMCLSLICTWEKLALSERCLTETLTGTAASETKVKEMVAKQFILWDGMQTISLGPFADVITNLFTRLGSLLAETPLILQIAEVLVARMAANETSTLRMIQSHSSRPLIEEALHGIRTDRYASPRLE